MSFANGQQWLGGVYVQAENFAQALTFTHLMGINPGGEVEMIAFYADWMDPNYVERLITDPLEWQKVPPPTNPVFIIPIPRELIGTPPTMPTPSPGAPEQPRHQQN